METEEEEPRAKLLFEDLFDGRGENNQIGTLEKFFKCESTGRTPQESGGLLPALLVPAWEGGRVVDLLHSPPSPFHFKITT